MVMRVVVVVLMGCVIAVVGSLSSSRSAAPPTDPFTPYGELLIKHQTLTAIFNYNFTCVGALMAGNIVVCSFKPERGLFSRVSVTIDYSSLPSSVGFDVNGLALRVGDLVAMWGMPEVIPQKGGVNLHWVERSAVAGIPTLSSNRLDYHAPVYFVSFTLN